MLFYIWWPHKNDAAARHSNSNIKLSIFNWDEIQKDEILCSNNILFTSLALTNSNWFLTCLSIWIEVSLTYLYIGDFLKASLFAVKEIQYNSPLFMFRINNRTWQYVYPIQPRCIHRKYFETCSSYELLLCVQINQQKQTTKTSLLGLTLDF